ncbi:toxin-antitoxin system YwqK family antitoxin [Spongiivirga citrea]|uniref:Toxin-antitoxin system YwqK family antitoxin n=1 Tax=Spongiivirga citrea TaxID=1481457 RepID=A0A6M0CDU2_9FLAO|nr:hypothetical protein [Spongiivirga citrea]NER15986.1 hypothetical protein [Spongiivirga citrea]
MKSLVVFLLLFAQSMVAQSINQFDENNERHGIWKKYFDGTKQLRYEGQFEHGKEVGLFKFYTRKSKDQPVATRFFKSGSTEVEVKFFALSGRLISKGILVDKKREGVWELFQKDGKTLLSKESYKSGELDGLYEIYYKNGKLSETFQYKFGLKDGPSKKYAPNQTIIHEVVYVDGKLRGPATYYDIKGSVIIKGEYAADRKAGLWKYYEGDKLVKEVDYKNWNKPVTIEY